MNRNSEVEGFVPYHRASSWQSWNQPPQWRGGRKLYLWEMPEGPSRQITGLHYTKTGPGRVSRQNGFSQGSWANEDKDSSVSAGGTDIRLGQLAKVDRGRPLVWVSGQNSRGPVLSTALFICKV